jgi:hypothetical protein
MVGWFQVCILRVTLTNLEPRDKTGFCRAEASALVQRIPVLHSERDHAANHAADSEQQEVEDLGIEAVADFTQVCVYVCV